MKHKLVLLAVLLVLENVTSIHREMSPLRLHHIFGTRSRDKVPEYWLDSPDRSISEGGFYYDVTIQETRERFWLEPKNHILADDFHVVTRDGDDFVTWVPERGWNCLYQGRSVSHNGSTIALTGCGEDMHGMVISADGDFFLIQPKEREHREHIIHKRSIEQREEQHTCLFDASTDPYPSDQHHTVRRSALMDGIDRVERQRRSEALTIELAVFADDALWRHFVQMHGSHADQELHKFLLAAVNNIDILYTQRSIQPRIQVRVVRYEVLKTPPFTLSSQQHSSGDVDRLLDSFCQYQHQINTPNDADPRHWDHALLFSGYDLYRQGLHTVAGYAPVKGMCSGLRSCTINEGLDFGSVFVVTHEMGHNLGMYHDGDNECDLRCCIMSPSVGSGKTHWSSCSVNEMTSFIGHLGNDYRPPNCLRDSPIEDQEMAFKDQDNPGQIFTLDEQCEIFHGECWKHELKDGQRIEDVCSMVWCGNGEGVIRTAHPALEGSYCGSGKQCRAGICVQSYRSLSIVHGGWSPWNDNPAAGCGGQCGRCLIQGQIRVRRSIRQCNQPSPNNGGAECQGDDARGLRCAKEVCSGPSITDYASRTCAAVRNDASQPNYQLTGEGIQFDQAPCKVWCLLSGSNNIRTVSNFPDGTPCGWGRHCIKGECRSLLCSGSTIAAYEDDCPDSVRPGAVQTPPPRTVDYKKTNPYKEDTKKVPPFWKEWSGWSEWSTCIAYSCDLRGVRVRARRCLAGECEGASRQRAACNNQCSGIASTARPPVATTQQVLVTRTAPRVPQNRQPWAQATTPPPWYSTTTTASAPFYVHHWTGWSACSVSCGQGKKLRRNRNCPTNENSQPHCIETSSCQMSICQVTSPPTVTGEWTGWSQWSPCSKTCDIGVQLRRRACSNGSCRGPESQGKRCRNRACSTAPSWTEWSGWSRCSVQCGQGTRRRARHCTTGNCQGDDRETAVCTSVPCNMWRSPRDTDYMMEGRGTADNIDSRAADNSRNIGQSNASTKKDPEMESEIHQSSGSTGTKRIPPATRKLAAEVEPFS